MQYTSCCAVRMCVVCMYIFFHQWRRQWRASECCSPPVMSCFDSKLKSGVVKLAWNRIDVGLYQCTNFKWNSVFLSVSCEGGMNGGILEQQVNVWRTQPLPTGFSSWYVWFVAHYRGNIFTHWWYDDDDELNIIPNFARTFCKSKIIIFAYRYSRFTNFKPIMFLNSSFIP